MNPVPTYRRRSGSLWPWAPVAILVAALLVSLWFAFVVAPRQRDALLARWHDQLSAMADDRKSAVERFIAERLEDASLVAGFPIVVEVLAGGETMSSWGPLVESPRAHLMSILALVTNEQDCVGTAVLRADGRVVASAGDPVGLHAAASNLLPRTLAARRPLVDLFLSSTKRTLLQVAAPVVPGIGAAAPTGVVVLTVDPEAWLFPFLRHQAVLSDTAETILVRREDDVVLYLSPLRHDVAATMTLRRALATPDLASAAALAGPQPFRSFVDYRGERTFAVTRRLHNAPWALVAKVDRSEALRGYRRGVISAAAAFLAVLLAIGGPLWGAAQRERALAREERLDEERRLAELVHQANDAVFVVSSTGQILQANRRAEELYGYRQEELRRLTIDQLRVPDSSGEHEPLLDEAATRDGVIVESLHCRSDGSVFPVEVSVRHADVRGERFLFETVRDITPHKQAEARIRDLNRLLRTITEVDELIVRAHDRDTLLRQACDVIVEHGGFCLAWIGFPDRERGVVAPAAVAGIAGEYLGEVEIRCDDSALGRGPTGTALGELRPVVANDWTTDTTVAPWREAGLARGIGSSAAFPLATARTKPGVLTVYAGRAGAFDKEAVASLGELAGDIAFALDSIATEQARAAAVDEVWAGAQRFHATLDQMLEGCQILGFDWTYQYVNESAARHGRTPREQLVGRRIADVYPGVECTEMFAALKRTMETRTPSHFENEFIYPDGSRAWFDLSVEPVPEGIFVLSVDITQRKRAEQALRESEQRYRSLFEQSPIGIYRTTPDGRILIANPALLHMLGYDDVEELLVRDLEAEGFEAGYPRERFKALLERDGEIRDFESTWTSRSGRKVHIVENARAIRDADGRVLYYEGAVENVTARRAAEEARARLAAAVEQTGEAVVVTDPQGTIEYVNPAFERITGYGRDEAVGRNPRLLKSGAQDAAFYASMWKTITSGQVWSGRMTNRRKDGSTYEEEATISPVRDSDGKIAHFVSVKRDVTRVLELQQQLNQAQKMEAIGRLAGGIAHDFNNLLQALLSHTQLLRAHAGDEARTREEAAELEQHVARGAALTRQLLLFSRRETTQPERLDLNDVTRTAAGMLRRLVPENVSFSVELADAPAAVDADRGQLEQVLVNLVVNALDAMTDGGRLVVRVGCERPDSAWLEVEDNGAGIPEEIRERIFEPFFTTKGRGKGTGLGLSVVHGIVTQHGGRMELESHEGTGTRFRVVLPRAGSGEFPRVTEAPAVAEELPSGAGERILVVEDEPGAREGLKEILAALGYEAVAVGSGAEAEALPDAPGFALLLTDLMLPDTPGHALAARLAQRWPGMAVVVMSGYAEDEAVRRGVEAGRTRFLQKPFDMQTLASAVSAALEARGSGAGGAGAP
jgi:two-component system cell cycle sensor histidine kinase/response regulator CckA